MSHVVRKGFFCICKNKDADQLPGNREADQHLCFRYTDSTIPLLSKYEISRLWPSSVAVQPGLCRTRSETLKTGFLRTRLTSACSVREISFSLEIYYLGINNNGADEEIDLQHYCSYRPEEEIRCVFDDN